MTPQQLVQQKRKSQQLGKESASQPGAEMSHEGSQQQQAVPSLAAQPGAEMSQSAQKQQQQQSLVEASTDQNSPGLGQNQAGAEVGSPKTSTMQTDYLFHFGDTTQIRKALEMPNRLTG